MQYFFRVIEMTYTKSEAKIIIDIIKRIGSDTTLTAEEMEEITGKRNEGGWTQDYGDGQYDYRFLGERFNIIASNRAGGNHFTIKCIEFRKPHTFAMDEMERFIDEDLEGWVKNFETNV